MTQRDLRIRPLSEGIGLGALRTPSPNSKVTEIDTPTMRQAHAAYAPNSVATEIRRRPANIARNSTIRFVVGIGTDILVGAITALMLAWVGAIAWSAGASGKFDVIGAFWTVADFVTMATRTQTIIALVCITVFWRIARVFLGRL